MTLRKLSELGYKVLPNPHYSPDIFPIDYHFLKYLDGFLRMKEFKIQADAENEVKEFLCSRTPDFYFTGINKLVTR